MSFPPPTFVQGGTFVVNATSLLLNVDVNEGKHTSTASESTLRNANTLEIHNRILGYSWQAVLTMLCFLTTHCHTCSPAI